LSLIFRFNFIIEKRIILVDKTLDNATIKSAR